ncbi:MAG: TetR/AcrR family transcriptional regulator [Actinomycetota bacterium]|nr:TetR/AcrR family transcriptional regulator [Actinomycetota bacterium]MDQ5807972.1 TetR/AcrR family transcriptional regulator [Actinomycetota bacterium]
MAVRERQGAGAASREAILDAAEQLMAAHGFAGASISRIEKASGLPASSIYWHFGSKDGVLLAVMQRGAERFFTSLPPTGDYEGSALERLQAALATAARLLDEHPQFLRLLITLGLQHGDEPEVMAIIRGVRRMARERFEEAVLDALDELPEAERAAAAAEIGGFGLAVADGAFIARHIDGATDLEPMFRQVGEALTALVTARTR